jgi:hypothetical protein
VSQDHVREEIHVLPLPEVEPLLFGRPALSLVTMPAELSRPLNTYDYSDGSASSFFVLTPFP